MPSPTLPELHAAVIEWAGIDRGNGSILSRANPVGQAAKTLEEIGEASQVEAAWMRAQDTTGRYIPLELWEWIDDNLPPKDAKRLTEVAMGEDKQSDLLVNALETMLATELGDVLVTLCIQAHMQGWTLASCIPPDPCSISTWDVPCSWENVKFLGSSFRATISAKMVGEATSGDVVAAILDIYRCVTNAAVTINRTPEQCLAAAYEKIKNRSGHINEQGQLVKAS